MTAPVDIAAKNEKTLRQIALAVSRSQGQFKLMRLRCDYRQEQRQWAERLQSLCGTDYGLTLPVLDLDPDNTKLFSQIQDFITAQATPPGGIQVMGFETLNDRPNALKTLNLIRENLNPLALPVLWWLDERGLMDLMHYANDLHSWSTGKQFLSDRSALVQIISQYAETLYNKLDTGTSDQWIGEWPLLSSTDRQEIDYLERENGEIVEINFHFIAGRSAYEQGDWQRAETHWRSAQALGAKSGDKSEATPWIAFHLGLAILKQAEQEESRQAEAATWFDQSCGLLPDLKPDLNQCSAIVLLRGWQRSSPERDVTALTPADLDCCIAALEPIAEFDRVGFPQLHCRALKRLGDLHYQRQHYDRAFELQQKRQEVERLYGLRAFIGAGRLKGQGADRFGGNLIPEIEQSGRGDDVRELLERIGGTTHRVIVIQGPSGVGKSSLVNAGLIPALEQAVMGGQGCLPVVVRRYKDWVKELNPPLTPPRRGIEAIEAISPSREGAGGVGQTFTATANPPLTPPRRGIEAIVALLEEQTRLNLRPVLIFDQFEEFFFAHPSLGAQRQFFEFLGQILTNPRLLSTKIVLSLRRDYLHLLLVCNALEGMKAISQDILSRQVLYPIDNLTPDRTERVIKTLTTTARFPLEAALVERLVTDLNGEDGVRPIELQIVGAQLQDSGIQTLAAYEALGENPKQTLVQNYLQSVVRACGPEQEELADLVLYVLTNEDGTRPLQTRPEILKAVEIVAREQGWDEETLEAKLSLVLKIFVGSGLVMLLPAQPLDQYQLVHDYLSAFIHSTRESRFEELVEKFKEEQRKRQAAEQSLAEVEQQKAAAQADLQRTKQQTQRWATWGTAAGVVAAVGITGALTWAGMQTQRATEQVEQADRSAQEKIDQASQEAEGKVNQANQQAKEIEEEADRVKLEANRQTKDAQAKVTQATQDLKQAQAEKQKADADVAAAQAEVAQAQGKSEQIQLAAQRNLDAAERKQAEADRQVRLASDKLAATNAQVAALNSQAAYLNNDTLQAMIWGLQAGAQYKALDPKGKPDCGKPDEKTQSLCNAYYPLMAALQQTLYSPTNGLTTNSLQHPSPVLSVSWSPDGETIATGSSDNTVKLWRKDGTLIQDLTGHNGYVWSVSWSPDGETIATGSDDNTVKLWRKDGTLIQDLTGHNGYVWSVSWSPDGETCAPSEQCVAIATGSSDNTVKLWRKDGTWIQDLTGHNGSVLSVSWSPDGETIATGSDDKTVKLWRKDGTWIQDLTGHTDWVRSVSWSPDGETIATGSDDKTVKLWDWNLDRSLAMGCYWTTDYRTRPNTDQAVNTLCQRPEVQAQLPGLLRIQAIETAQTGNYTAALNFLGNTDRTTLDQQLRTFASAALSGKATQRVRFYQLTSLSEIYEDENSATFSNDLEKFESLTASRQREGLWLLNRAKTIDPQFDLDQAQEALAEKLNESIVQAIQSLIYRGDELAAQNDREGAIQRYQAALQLDPQLDLNPEAQFQTLAAQSFVNQGDELQNRSR